MLRSTGVRGVASRLCVLLLLGPGSAASQPLQQVPDGLSASQYYELGKQYKAAGWPEQAREALTRSMKADPQGVGKKADIYLRAYIPRDPVPAFAVQMNIDGYNKMAQGDQAGAIRAFRECIDLFPRFEWPYGNLGSIYTEQGRTKEAKEILEKAVTINPSYVNGWLHLVEANLKDRDLKAARDAVQTALQLDPENPYAQLLLQLITAQQALAFDNIA